MHFAKCTSFGAFDTLSCVSNEASESFRKPRMRCQDTTLSTCRAFQCLTLIWLLFLSHPPLVEAKRQLQQSPDVLVASGSVFGTIDGAASSSSQSSGGGGASGGSFEGSQPEWPPEGYDPDCTRGVWFSALTIVATGNAAGIASSDLSSGGSAVGEETRICLHPSPNTNLDTTTSSSTLSSSASSSSSLDCFPGEVEYDASTGTETGQCINCPNGSKKPLCAEVTYDCGPHGELKESSLQCICETGWGLSDVTEQCTEYLLESGEIFGPSPTPSPGDVMPSVLVSSLHSPVFTIEDAVVASFIVATFPLTFFLARLLDTR